MGCLTAVFLLLVSTFVGVSLFSLNLQFSLLKSLRLCVPCLLPSVSQHRLQLPQSRTGTIASYGSKLAKNLALHKKKKKMCFYL